MISYSIGTKDEIASIKSHISPDGTMKWN